MPDFDNNTDSENIDTIVEFFTQADSNGRPYNDRQHVHRTLDTMFKKWLLTYVPIKKEFQRHAEDYINDWLTDAFNTNAPEAIPSIEGWNEDAAINYALIRAGYTDGEIAAITDIGKMSPVQQQQ